MNKLSTQNNTSEKIIQNFETFKSKYTTGLDEQFSNPHVASQNSDDLTNLKERVLVLELNLHHAVENFKKDLELLCVELSNQCEQNTNRTQINEENISEMNDSCQELVGQFNQISLEINEMKTALSDSKERRRSFTDNFILPLLVTIASSVIGVLCFFLGKYMTMGG